MPASAHLADSGGNTFGTTFDILIRPDVSDDMRCNDLLRKVAESIVVAFPQSSQRAIEDSIIAAIAAADGRFASLNLNKISKDRNNTVEAGTDGGIYVARRPFATATASTTNNDTGSFSLPLINFPDTNYLVTVEPNSDPGNDFRWWVTSRTAGAVTIGFYTNSATSLNVTAMA